jgi:hypothetical protein
MKKRTDWGISNSAHYSQLSQKENERKDISAEISSLDDQIRASKS